LPLPGLRVGVEGNVDVDVLVSEEVTMVELENCAELVEMAGVEGKLLEEGLIELDLRSEFDMTEEVKLGENGVPDEELVGILDVGITGIEEAVETYVDEVKDDPDDNGKELVSGIEAGVLEAGMGLLLLDKDDKDGVPIDVLLLLGADELLDGAELVT
jgi:hypothetical protein